jgi:hypothetical protein
MHEPPESWALGPQVQVDPMRIWFPGQVRAWQAPLPSSPKPSLQVSQRVVDPAAQVSQLATVQDAWSTQAPLTAEKPLLQRRQAGADWLQKKQLGMVLQA